MNEWDAVRLRRICEINPPTPEFLSISPDDPVTFLPLEAIWSDALDTSRASPKHQLESGYTRFREGDVLVPKITPTFEASRSVVARSLSGGVGCGTTELHVLRPRAGLDTRFLFYITHSERFLQDGIASMQGVAGQKRVPESVIANYLVDLPSLDIQRKIADFLDRETARIDVVIRQRARARELLRERRRRVIATAVSGGMDSASIAHDVLLGRRPEGRNGWPVRRLKHVVSRIVDTEHATAPDYVDGQYLIVGTANVRDGELRLEGAKYTDEKSYWEWTKRGVPKPGDILFTREAPAGQGCIVPEDVPLCIGQRMVLICVDSAKLDSRYALYSLYGGPPQEFMKLLSRGSTVEHLNMRDVPNIPLVVPSVDAQTRIADFLDQMVGQLEGAVDKLEAQIGLLREHRQTLITAAVTGQIDLSSDAA